MIENKDYYYLIHESKNSVHYTCIHSKTSCEGLASWQEWIAQGAEGEPDYVMVKHLAYQRMLESVVRYYEKG